MIETMQLIEKRTIRIVCDRCHRITAEARIGEVCDECRGIAGMKIIPPRPYRPTARALKYANRPYAAAV